MSARAYPPISPISLSRATQRRTAPARPKARLAAGLALAVAAWAAYATPAQRWRALPIAGPLLAALAPAERPLTFGPVSARRGEINGQTVLYVEGSLVNAAAQKRKTPALRITLVGDDGQPLYSWTAKAAKAEMEASAEFRTRLLSPPEKFRDITIGFVDAG